MKKIGKRKSDLRFLLVFILLIPLVILPVFGIAAYESIFGIRYETQGAFGFSAEDFEGLQVLRSDFTSGDNTLAGYQYAREGQEVKGVVIFAHGLGGGHKGYIPFVDYFTSNGYYVFAYDVTGNDNSHGASIRGLPQGIIDLDLAISHARELPEYRDLPLFLFGHSWGGYCVGNVLNFHPEIEAAVIIAGFNETEDLLEYQGEQLIGGGVKLMLPYIKLYERLKFGRKYTDISAIQGMENTEAEILVIHSKDDTTVPAKYGYDKFYAVFGSSERFDFVLYENKGHNFSLDSAMMGQILEMFDRCCQN